MGGVSDRIARVQTVLRERGLAALLVGASADLRYLTGYHALATERLTLLVVPAAGHSTLVVPALEQPRAAATRAPEVAELVTWGETDDPIHHVTAALAVAGVRGAGPFAVGDRLWSTFLLRLQAALPGATWHPGGEVMRELRIVKAPDEIVALRAAGAAIDTVHARVPEVLRPGRTEAEVGRDLAELIAANHDEVAFVIVASGPNGASPHHENGHRRLEPGDAVVVDIGGVLDGYC